MHVGNERSLIAIGTQAGVDVLKVLSLANALCGKSYILATSIDDALSLCDRLVGIGGRGGGHRLDAYGIIATHGSVAHMSDGSLAPLVIKESDHSLSWSYMCISPRRGRG